MIRFYRLNYLGLLVGLTFVVASLTPSLIPRTIILQSVVSAICFMFGYGFGVMMSWAIRRTFHTQLPDSLRRIAWLALFTLVPVTTILFGFKASEWQNVSRTLVELPPFSGQEIIQFLVLLVLTSSILLALCRSVALGMRALTSLTSRLLPPRIGRFVGVSLGVILIVLLCRAIALNLGVGLADWMYVSINEHTPPGLIEPTNNPLRSGGLGSAVTWDSLGRQGRRFIGSPISADKITSLTGQPAREPIRVYIGVKTSRDPVEQARIAVDELKRTGAFDRRVLLVATPTGTGWLEPQIMDAFDYVYGGDTATVATQYSYLPSWASVLVDHERAGAAGRELFNAVYDVWKDLPPDGRPKLLVHGLSLGSSGMQEAFSGVDDLTNRTDGALFAGTPNSTRLWRQFTAGRDTGSPEWQPIYKGGETVRWFASGDDFEKLGNWDQPRIGYLQHASDAVIWWSWDLLWRQPDWLKEPRGPDVNPEMRWYPVVTFVQVSIDQATANQVPSGHGHNYENAIVRNWNSILPSGLSDDTLDRIQAEIDTYPLKSP